MELHLRDAELSDLGKGLVELLGQLTTIGHADWAATKATMTELLSLSEIYKIVVIEDTTQKRIIATARLMIEKKLTRSCGKCGHIEDVVVDKAFRGQKLGVRLLEALMGYAQEVRCYKVILDCAESNIEFYEKCGFVKKDIQMAKYLADAQ